MLWLEFKLTYYNFRIKHVSHHAMVTAPYIYILARLCEWRFMKETVSFDCRHADGWLGQCGTGKSSCSDCSLRSSLVWLLRLPRFSSCGVSPSGWPCGSLQRWRWPGGRCASRPDDQQQVSTTSGGQYGRYRGSWESLYDVSLVPLGHSGQWRVHHTRISWAGDSPLFWRHAQPSIVVNSAI